ncbi:helix-turn-helix domain-containing protein [Actinokineospora fastidiosa]|uniref:Transcriptional regulator n=1 Tax=Actinokineospora fastidiosa TaxID=1816 RepID=A0A918LDI5_9PSEU|nr:helix-turn-helix transcriptional regulator [Actinokineospora fastidiosa]GGS33707.1 transcriptional regulator [Actinokineospora fastidiosa]
MSDIGRRLRHLRHARGKSLAVVAGLAGISPSYLSRIENGQRAVDRRSLIVALANALDVSPTELVHEALPVTARGSTDAAVDQVRRALLAVTMGHPAGGVVPVAVLADRVSAVLDAQQRCEHDVVGRALPMLIRDVHANPDARRLIPLLHVQGTQAWLRDVGAPLDLGWQAATIARQAADALDDPVPRGLAAFGVAHGLLAAGAYDLASDVLGATERDTSTSERSHLAGMLAFTDSLLAICRGDKAASAAALDHAADLADHVGEGNALWFGFGPSNVAVWRMAVALEAGDHAAAAAIATQAIPDAIPSPQRRAAYWADYGRALAHLPNHRDAAITALRRAEQISPTRVHHHPFTRSVLAELLTTARADSAGRELRGMAYRAGLLPIR